MLQLHSDARALAVEFLRCGQPDPAVAAGEKDMLVRSSTHGRHSLRLNARRTNGAAVVPPAVRGRGMAHAVRRTCLRIEVPGASLPTDRRGLIGSPPWVWPAPLGAPSARGGHRAGAHAPAGW